MVGESQGVLRFNSRGLLRLINLRRTLNVYPRREMPDSINNKKVKIRDGWYKTCLSIVYLALGGVKRWGELNRFIDYLLVVVNEARITRQVHCWQRTDSIYELH